MKHEKEKAVYVLPRIEATDVAVERGFEGSWAGETMKSMTSKKRSGDNPQPHETMRKTYLALAAAGLILASCQKDNEPSAQLPPTAPRSAMTLLGTIDASAPESRTHLDEEAGGGGEFEPR